MQRYAENNQWVLILVLDPKVIQSLPHQGYGAVSEQVTKGNATVASRSHVIVPLGIRSRYKYRRFHTRFDLRFDHIKTSDEYCF